MSNLSRVIGMKEQTEKLGDGDGGDADVRLVRKDRETDFEMGVRLVVVSLNVGGVDAEPDKMVVRELPRAGPFLPVYEADVLARQVLEAADIQRVVAGNEKAQLPVVEVHDHGLDVGHVDGQEGDVVFARFRVEEVRPRDVRVALLRAFSPSVLPVLAENR